MATNSNLYVRNCTFQKPYLKNEHKGIGIYVLNSSDDKEKVATTWDGYYQLKIDDESYMLPENKTNVLCPPVAFFDETFGVKNNKYFKLFITDADFRSNQYVADPINYGGAILGLYGLFYYTDRYDNWKVENNRFVNIANPIEVNLKQGQSDIDNNLPFITSTMFINSNQIDLNLGGRDASNDHFVDNAITFNAESDNSKYGNVDDYINCHLNKINGAWRGIAFNNLGNKNISSTYNDIYLKGDPKADPQFGISLVGGSTFTNSSFNNLIKNNKIYGDNNEADQTGIYVSMNDMADLRCNYVHNLNKGISFNGSSFKAKCLSNNFESSNQYGLYLDNNAQIGTQGTPDYPADNDWLTDADDWNNLQHFKTAAANGTDAGYSPMYIRVGSTNFDPSNSNNGSFPNFAYDIYNYGTSGPFNGQNLIQSYPICNNDKIWCNGNDCDGNWANKNRKSYLGRGGQPLPDSILNAIAAAERIATAQINIPSSDSAERIAVMQQQLFNSLITDTVLLNNSSVLYDFMQSPVANSYWFNGLIGDILSRGDGSTAIFALGMWQPQNKVDSNFYQYYSWLANLDLGFGIQDTAAVYGLASACPFTNGTVVYWARNLYNQITEQHIIFKNNCGGNNIAAKKLINIVEKKISSINEVKIFPNPTTGLVNITFPFGVSGSKYIKVTDVYGKVCLKKVIAGSENKVSINLIGSPGIYFLTIDCNNGFPTITKLLLK